VDLLQLAQVFGLPVALLLLGVYAFATGRVIPRLMYDEVKADRDAWRRVAEKATDALEELGDVADKAVKQVVRR
jgi:hypothetical protein